MKLQRLLLLPVVLFVIQAQPHAQRVNTPRIKPIEPSEWTAEHREILGSRAQSGNAAGSAGLGGDPLHVQRFANSLSSRSTRLPTWWRPHPSRREVR